MNFDNLKIALVADWMTNFAGAEQVLLSLSELFPNSPIYTSVYVPEKMRQFSEKEVKTTFLQKIPIFYKKHQFLLKWMPLAFESLDLSDFDIVVSSSHACSKGVITKPETMHICYCHTPMRVAWDDFHSYIKRYNINPLIKKLIPGMLTDLRIWDRLAADRVDFFVANSKFIKNRIQKYYRREAEVIYPPVKINDFSVIKNPSRDYYLAVGRLVPNKNMDLLVETFNETGDKLLIVGDGIDFKSLQKKAAKNVSLLGSVDFKSLVELYQNCEAFLMPQEEDFGIAPLEAMACGRPVIAFAGGGALETVIENRTGIFFSKQEKESLKDAINRFKKLDFAPHLIREHAEQFSEERFKKEIKKFIKAQYSEWKEFMC